MKEANERLEQENQKLRGPGREDDRVAELEIQVAELEEQDAQRV